MARTVLGGCGAGSAPEVCSSTSAPIRFDSQSYDPYRISEALLLDAGGAEGSIGRPIDFSDVSPSARGVSWAALRLWVQGLVPAFLVLLVPQAVQLAASISAGFSRGSLAADWIPWPVWIVVVVPLLMAAEAGAAFVYHDRSDEKGGHLTAAAAFYLGFSRLSQVVQALVFMVLATGACLVPAVLAWGISRPLTVPCAALGLIVAVFLWARWMIVLPLIAVEGMDPRRAFATSAAVTRGHVGWLWWPALFFLGGGALLSVAAAQASWLARALLDVDPRWAVAIEIGVATPIAIAFVASQVALKIAVYRVLPRSVGEIFLKRLVWVSDPRDARALVELLTERGIAAQIERSRQMGIVSGFLGGAEILVTKTDWAQAEEVMRSLRDAPALWDRDEDAVG